MTLIEYVVLGIIWMVSVVTAFTWGEMRGSSRSDKWWTKNGAKYFAEYGAVIYGTALYKEPARQAENPSSTQEKS